MINVGSEEYGASKHGEATTYTVSCCGRVVHEVKLRAVDPLGKRNGLGRIRTYDQPVMSRPLCH